MLLLQSAWKISFQRLIGTYFYSLPMESHCIVGTQLHRFLFVQLIQKLFLVLIQDAFAALPTYDSAVITKEKNNMVNTIFLGQGNWVLDLLGKSQSRVSGMNTVIRWDWGQFDWLIVSDSPLFRHDGTTKIYHSYEFAALKI